MQQQTQKHRSKRSSRATLFTVAAAVTLAVVWGAWFLLTPDPNARYEHQAVTDVEAPLEQPTREQAAAVVVDEKSEHVADQPHVVVPETTVGSPEFKLLGVLMREEIENRTAIIAVESTPAESYGVEQKVGTTDTIVHSIEKDSVLLKHPDGRQEQLLLTSSEGAVADVARPILTKSGKPLPAQIQRDLEEFWGRRAF